TSHRTILARQQKAKIQQPLELRPKPVAIPCEPSRRHRGPGAQWRRDPFEPSRLRDTIAIEVDDVPAACILGRARLGLVVTEADRVKITYVREFLRYQPRNLSFAAHIR